MKLDGRFEDRFTNRQNHLKKMKMDECRFGLTFSTSENPKLSTQIGRYTKDRYRENEGCMHGNRKYFRQTTTTTTLKNTNEYNGNKH